MYNSVSGNSPDDSRQLVTELAALEVSPQKRVGAPCVIDVIHRYSIYASMQAKST